MTRLCVFQKRMSPPNDRLISNVDVDETSVGCHSLHLEDDLMKNADSNLMGRNLGYPTNAGWLPCPVVLWMHKLVYFFLVLGSCVDTFQMTFGDPNSELGLILSTLVKINLAPGLCLKILQRPADVLLMPANARLILSSNTSELNCDWYNWHCLSLLSGFLIPTKDYFRDT